MGKFEKKEKFQVKVGRLVGKLLGILTIDMIGCVCIALFGWGDFIEEMDAKLGANVVCCIGLVVIVVVYSLISVLISAVRKNKCTTQ